MCRGSYFFLVTHRRNLNDTFALAVDRRGRLMGKSGPYICYRVDEVC